MRSPPRGWPCAVSGWRPSKPPAAPCGAAWPRSSEPTVPRGRRLNPRGAVKDKLRADSPPRSENRRHVPTFPIRSARSVVSFLRSVLALRVLAAVPAGVAVPLRAHAPPRARGERGNRAERMPEPQRDREPPRSRADRQRSQDALADSVRRFERSRGGRVLSAERMQTADDRDVNRIKAMDERGRV